MLTFKVEMITHDGRGFSATVQGFSATEIFASIEMMPGDLVTITRVS